MVAVWITARQNQLVSREILLIGKVKLITLSVIISEDFECNLINFNNKVYFLFFQVVFKHKLSIEWKIKWPQESEETSLTKNKMQFSFLADRRRKRNYREAIWLSNLLGTASYFFSSNFLWTAHKNWSDFLKQLSSFLSKTYWKHI